MTKLLLTWIFVAVTALLVAQPNVASKLNKKGSKKLKVGENQEALSLFSQSIEAYQLTNAVFNRAITYSRLSNLEGCCKDLNVAALARDPEGVQLYKETCVDTVVTYFKNNQVTHKDGGFDFRRVDTKYRYREKFSREFYSVSDSLFFAYYEQAEQRIYTKLDTMPTYLGYDSTLVRHVARNVRLPSAPFLNSLRMEVWCTIIIDEHGEISSSEVITMVGESHEDLVKKVIAEADKFKPAVYKGQPVKYSVSFAIVVSSQLLGIPVGN